MVKPPVVHIGGPAARRIGARDRHRRTGPGSDSSPGSSSSTRRTSPGGTTPAGSTRRPSGAAGSPSRASCSTARSTRTTRRTTSRRTRTRSSTARSRSGPPAARRRDPPRRSRLRDGSPGTAKDDWQRGAYPVLVENALRQLSPYPPTCRPPDGVLRRAPRAELLRARPRRGRPGCPAIEPGMPPPAGSELAPRVPRALARARADRLRRRPASLFDEDRAAAAAAPQRAVLVTIFLEGGADALSLLYPDGDPLYRKLRPKLALPGGTPFSEDDRLHWHPSLDPLAQLHAEGKVTVLRRSATTTPTSRTSPRGTSGRSGRRSPASDRLARPLPRPRRDDGQPAPGRVAHRSAPAGARDEPRARRGDRRPGEYDFWTQRRVGRRRGPDARHARGVRRALARDDPGRCARWRTAPRSPTGCAASCAVRRQVRS